MNRLTKVLVLCSASLVFIIGMVVCAFLYLFNPNSLKPLIEAQAYQATGRQLVIGGDIHWSLFPKFGVDVSDVTLSNLSPKEKDPFIHVDQASLTIKLKPLITQKIVETGGISITGLDIHLNRDKNGRYNWQAANQARKSIVLAQANTALQQNNNPIQDSSASVGQQNSESKRVASERKLIKEIAIRNVSIQEARVFWKDDKLNKAGTIVLNNFHTKHINLQNKPFPISVDMNIDGEKPNVSGNLTLMSMVKINKENRTFAMQDSDVKLSLQNATKNEPIQSLTFNGHFNLDTDKQQLNMSTVQVGLNSMTMSGQVYAKNIMDNPEFQGNMTITKFNLADFLTSLGVSIPMDTTHVLQQAQGQFDFQGNTKTLTFSKLNLSVDKSNINGNATVLLDKPKVTFALKMNKLNVNDYLNPAQKNVKVAENNVMTVTDTATQNDSTPTVSIASNKISQKILAKRNITSMQPLQAQGTLQLGSLTINKMNINNLQMTLAMQNQQLQLKPITADLYKGTFNGDVKIDNSRTTPAYSINGQLQQVQVEPLMQDLMGSDTISGVLNTKGNLSAYGQDKQSLLQSLDGKIAFQVTNGQITGMDLSQALSIAATIVNKQVPPPSTGKTEFGELTGTMNINSGVGVNPDLYLNSPLVEVKGHGKLNFVTQGLNYSLMIKTNDDKLSQFQDLKKLLGGSIPVNVSGTLNNPKVSVDKAIIQKLLFKDQVQDTLSKVGKLFN